MVNVFNPIQNVFFGGLPQPEGGGGGGGGEEGEFQTQSVTLKILKL